MGKCLKQLFKTILFVVLVSQFQFSNVYADTVTKPHTWVDGETPTAALWNANEDAIITGVNNVASAQITDATIVNADINGSAAIAYSKLTLTGSIVNADISASAAIVDTKLATISTADKVNTSALITTSEAQGDILYNDGDSWERLGPGTSGYFLKTQGAAANPIWSVVGTNPPRTAWNNLVVTKSTNSAIIVTADELVLQNTSFDPVRITSVSETLTITTSGASGLVAALSETANTLYYVWIARKSSDGTVNGFLSTSSVFATALSQFDSGYDQGALVSVVGNDNSSNFIGFTQTGRKYNFTSWASMASGTLGTWSTVLTGVDLTPANMSTNPGFVPSALSNFCFGSMHVASSVSGVIANVSTATGDTTTVVANRLAWGQVSPEHNYWQFDVLTADTLYVMSTGAVTVYLQGFEITKLG